MPLMARLHGCAHLCIHFVPSKAACLGQARRLWHHASYSPTLPISSNADVRSLQAPVRSIAFAPGGRFAASAAQGERHIVLWDLGGDKAKKQDGKRPKRAAAGLLSCDEPAHALVLGAAEAAGDFLVSAAAWG